jgi:hypothetical protein
VAQKVVTDLVNAGFSRDDISLVTSDAEGRYQKVASHEKVKPLDDLSAGEGALVGGAEGGLIGLALGFGALAIPGIGPVLAFGPLIAGLIGAGAGAITGGLAAGLIDSGIDETDANVYAEAVRRGFVLLTLHAPEGRENEAKVIMNRYGVVDLDDRADYWRTKEGWTGYDVQAKPFTVKDIEAEQSYYKGTSVPAGSTASSREKVSVRSYATPTMTTGQHDFNSQLEDFRKHYQANYASNQYSFSSYQPAYQYGYKLADDVRYRDRTWTEIEPEVRRDWETRNQGAWEDFKDSVRYAWERAKAFVS